MAETLEPFTCTPRIGAEPRWTWFGISVGYHLIGLVVSAVIVSVWV
jgi:hypothetical protein